MPALFAAVKRCLEDAEVTSHQYALMIRGEVAIFPGVAPLHIRNRIAMGCTRKVPSSAGFSGVLVALIPMILLVPFSSEGFWGIFGYPRSWFSVGFFLFLGLSVGSVFWLIACKSWGDDNWSKNSSL